MNPLITATIASLIGVGVLLLMLILVQRGRGTGGFPGSGGGHTVLGTKATEFLTWVTASTFGLFLLLAVLLNLMLS